MNEATAAPIEIWWTVANVIGFLAAMGLVAITWRRRSAVFAEEHPRTPKGPRIRKANRQLSIWTALVLFHGISTMLGVAEMADAAWPGLEAGWVLVGLAAMLAGVSVVNLAREAQR